MIGVTVSITRWVSDDQPGFVECRLIDAHGREWAFIEKAPVLTQKALDPSSAFPQACAIACRVVARRPAADGLEIVRVDTTEPWGVSATDGTTVFEVLSGELVELRDG